MLIDRVGMNQDYFKVRKFFFGKNDFFIFRRLNRGWIIIYCENCVRYLDFGQDLDLVLKKFIFEIFYYSG